MTIRTKGEVIGSVMKATANASKPHEVADWIRQDTLPFFRGNFTEVVEALATAGNGTSFQDGAEPSTWDHIQRIGHTNARLGDALTAMAVEYDVPPPQDRFDIGMPV